MIKLTCSDIGSILEVKTEKGNYSSKVVEIPFYDQKKIITKK
jgi:hypothetical protein